MPRKRLLSDVDILAAAGRVFGRVGPSQFTLADVAEEAGLAPATLVQRFGSKRALLLAFAEHATRLAQRPFEEAEARGYAPLDTLRAALLLASRATRDREELAQSLAFLLENPADAELREHAARHARWVESSIRDLLERARAQGQLAPIDTARLARALSAAWNGALLQWTIRGRGPLAAWIGTVVDTILDAYVVADEAAERSLVSTDTATSEPSPAAE